MLTICMVTPFFPRYRGDMLGISVALLAKDLARRGYTVSIITLSKAPRSPTNAFSVYRLPKMAWLAGRFILPVITNAYAFGKALHVYPGVDVIHYHWALPFPCVSGIMANEILKEKKPSIVTVRGTDLRSGLRNICKYSIIKKILEKVNRVVAISQGMWSLTRAYSVPPDKLTIIPNGVNTDVFTPEVKGTSVRNEFGIGNSPLVVSVGFKKVKGMEYLIRSIPKVLSSIRDAKFILIGTVEKRKAELQSLARKLNANEATIFACNVPYNNMPKFFQTADVVATLFSKKVDKQPYILPTEFGRVHLEAMACGTPIVTSVAKQLIDDWRIGFRAGANADEIASTIIRVLQDKKHSEQMGKNARKLISKYYSIKVTTEQYLQLYREVTEPYHRSYVALARNTR